MATPLEPRISVVATKHLTVCNCCGVSDGTVLHLQMRWQDGPRLGGGAAVGLCSACRQLTIEALEGAR